MSPFTFEETWKAAGRDEADFDPPDGAFEAQLVDAAAFISRSDKNFVKLTWELREGPHVDQQFMDLKGIDHEVGMRITREKLVMLGLDRPDDIKTIDELHEAVKKLIGTEATIGIKHDGTWLNVNVLIARTGESDIPLDAPEVPELSSEERDFADSLGDDDGEEALF